jgi:hypothetical protein
MTIGICDPVDFPRQFWVGHKRDMGSGSACDSPVDPSQNEHKRGQRRRGGIGNGTGGRDGRLGRSYLSLRCSPAVVKDVARLVQLTRACRLRIGAMLEDQVCVRTRVPGAGDGRAQAVQRGNNQGSR